MRILISAVILAVTGFACGFLGPLALNPESNLGPALGIFVSGPAGLMIGFLFGVVTTVKHVSDRVFGRSLAMMAAAIAFVTLYKSLPPDRLQSYVIDAEVVRCEPANLFLEEASKRAGWCHDVSRMSDGGKGVMLTMLVHRRWEVYERRKPWQRGQLVALPVRRNMTGVPVPGSGERYFVWSDDSSCATYTSGSRALYSPTRHSSPITARYALSECLGLYALENLPERYRTLIAGAAGQR